MRTRALKDLGDKNKILQLKSQSDKSHSSDATHARALSLSRLTQADKPASYPDMLKDLQAQDVNMAIIASKTLLDVAATTQVAECIRGLLFTQTLFETVRNMHD